MKFKDKILKNKKNLLIGASILIIIIIVALVIFLSLSKKDNEITVEDLEGSLKTIGIDFYENFYYSNAEEEQIANLSSFKDSGIKINVDNLDLIISIPEEVKNKIEKDKCDTEETKVIIYPEEPYGLKDYTIEVELVCEK